MASKALVICLNTRLSSNSYTFTLRRVLVSTTSPMLTKLSPSFAHVILSEANKLPPEIACVRISLAFVSVTGATHSPIDITNNTINKADFMAEVIIFQRLCPAACITTNSLLLAKIPIPINPPIKVAIGKNCSSSLGKLSNTYTAATVIS